MLDYALYGIVSNVAHTAQIKLFQESRRHPEECYFSTVGAMSFARF